jgi:hypothetical protein
MRGRIAAFVGVFCIAGLMTSSVFAGKPPKPPKPPKPDVSKAECIVFTGDLQSVEGSTEIEGCCPHAGPWPAYTMTLNVAGIPFDTYDGQLFINFFGTGPTAQYKVEFWTWDADNETPGDGDYFFQIYGGVLDRDRKAKTLTVTFDGSELATGWVYDDAGGSVEISIPGVSFVLFRTSNLSLCPDP